VLYSNDNCDVRSGVHDDVGNHTGCMQGQQFFAADDPLLRTSALDIARRYLHLLHRIFLCDLNLIQSAKCVAIRTRYHHRRVLRHIAQHMKITQARVTVLKRAVAAGEVGVGRPHVAYKSFVCLNPRLGCFGSWNATSGRSCVSRPSGAIYTPFILSPPPPPERYRYTLRDFRPRVLKPLERQRLNTLGRMSFTRPILGCSWKRRWDVRATEYVRRLYLIDQSRLL
jgi:hypothetical protein